MVTVKEHRIAVCITQEGGMGIIYKNKFSEDQAMLVNLVKRSELDEEKAKHMIFFY